MARGRRPDPAGVAEAKGNPGKRRRVAVPEAAAAITTPPAQLTDAAARVWSTLAPELERLKLLRALDVPAFARYCENLARWWDIQQKLRTAGKLTYWTESAHGKLKRVEPLFVVQQHVEKRLAELEERFGLTPAARQRILLQMAARPAELPLGDPPQPGAGETTEAPPETPAESPIGLLARASGSVH